MMRPTYFDTVLNSRPAYARMFGPCSYTLGFIAYCEQIIITSVPIILTPSYPSTVERPSIAYAFLTLTATIVTAVVYTINFMPRWKRTVLSNHFFAEIFWVIIPPVTHFYTFGFVSCIDSPSRTIPSFKFWHFAEAVCCAYLYSFFDCQTYVFTPCFIAKTTITSSVPRFNRPCIDFTYIWSLPNF